MLKETLWKRAGKDWMCNIFSPTTLLFTVIGFSSTRVQRHEGPTLKRFAAARLFTVEIKRAHLDLFLFDAFFYH